jgi:WD40 repeat protein/tRNA A-37 threonylcarbamoyl transferase component Bud32
MAEPPNPPDRERLLDDVVLSYLKAVDAGEAPDPRDVIANNPDLADDLIPFFEQEKCASGVFASMTASLERAGGADAGAAGLVGRTLGDCEVLKEIDRGGMGIVYKARQKRLNRPVALKVIRRAELADAGEVDRFRRDAEHLAALDHPNIVKLYEVGDYDGLPYLVMQLIDGDSLARCLPRYAADPRAAARLVATSARAVHHAHQRRILHRDLKPANILIDADGQPHVTDFGLARKIEGSGDATPSGAVVGTPEYMAPEQARGDTALTTAADVYGLGAVLYALLAGRPPFQAGSTLETLRQVCEQEPTPPSRFQPRADRDLQTVCLKCLDKEPGRRYGSAEALADDLERWLRGEPIVARPGTAWERVAKWARRRPAAAALAAVSGLAAVLLVVVLAVSNRLIAQRQSETESALGEKGKAMEGEQLAAYFNSTALAARELEAENVGRAEELLDGCPEALRGWEWNYLKRLRDGPPPALPGHSGWGFAVAFSPDGRRLTSAGLLHSVAGEVLIRDLTHPRSRPVRSLRGDVVMNLASSPDGRHLAVACLYRLEVCDAATGEVVWGREKERHFWTGLAYSPDGKTLATGGTDRAVRLWDAATGEELPGPLRHPQESHRVAFRPDGRVLATGCNDGVVRLWDVASRTELLALPGHRGSVQSVAFSPDGTLLATGGFDATVILRDAESGRELRRLTGHKANVQALAFSPKDGKRLASGSFDRTIKLWDPATGHEALTLRGHTDAVQDVAWSPDGLRLASTGWDGAVKVWDAGPRGPKGGRDPLRRYESATPVLQVAFDPDGRHVAVASVDGTVRRYDFLGGTEAWTAPAHTMSVSGLSFSRDRRLAWASLDGTVAVHDADTGRVVLPIEGHEGFAVSSVAFSPDGERLATASWDKTAKVWEARTGKLVCTLQGSPLPVLGLGFSPDGQRVVTGGADRSVRVWDAQSGKRLWMGGSPLRELLGGDGHDHLVPAVAYAPDGQHIASCSWDRTVKVWDATGQVIRTLTGHRDRVMHVAFSPDGTRLASAGWDGTVRVWDWGLADGKAVAVLPGHLGVVYSVAYSPDGKYLASASSSASRGEVTVWETAGLEKEP